MFEVIVGEGQDLPYNETETCNQKRVGRYAVGSRAESDSGYTTAGFPGFLSAKLTGFCRILVFRATRILALFYGHRQRHSAAARRRRYLRSLHGQQGPTIHTSTE